MSTIQLESKVCPGCGAAMPPIAPEADRVNCVYCGRDFTVVRKRSVAEPARPPRPSSEAHPGRGAALTGAFMLAIGAVTTVPIVIVFGVIGVQEGLQHELGVDLGRLVGQPYGATATLRWLDQYAAPALADVDGDERLDLLALHRRRGDPDDHSWLGAYSGHDLSELWLYGPIQGDPVRQVGLVVVGDRVVLQEPHGLVSVLALNSGERLTQLQLPKNPRWARLCAPQEGEPRVFLDDVAVLDARALTLLDTPGARRTSWPDSCRFRRPASNTTETGDTYATALTRRRASPREGIEVQSILQDGAHQVVIGKSNRGKQQPLLIGESPESSEELWRMPISALADGQDIEYVRATDLGEGTVYVAYATDFHEASRFAFLDATSGEVLARGSLRGRFGDTVTFGDGRAFIVDYVGADTRIVIYDVRSGPAIDTSTEGPLIFGRP
ncbi:MAG: hypothetical protein EA397_02365 [Deltaproteobacteria bacterium]|nr:MAG: hypothetical protein EA397_02365 [Deltaproteobacteria bacterium]